MLPNGAVLNTLSTEGRQQNSNSSDFAQVTVTPGSASVSLSNLSQTYTGSPRSVTVTTDPPGLNFSVTYAGFPSAPSLPGIYLVEARVTDLNYQGGANGNLRISGVDDPSGDSDGDGFQNILEYALATQPSGSLVTLMQPPTNGVLTLSAIVRTNDPGLGYTAHGVTNLADYAVTNLITQISGTASADTNNVPTGFQRQDFKFTNNASRAFLRLNVQQQ